MKTIIETQPNSKTYNPDIKAIELFTNYSEDPSRGRSIHQIQIEGLLTGILTYRFFRQCKDAEIHGLVEGVAGVENLYDDGKELTIILPSTSIVRVLTNQLKDILSKNPEPIILVKDDENGKYDNYFFATKAFLFLTLPNHKFTINIGFCEPKTESKINKPYLENLLVNVKARFKIFNLKDRSDIKKAMESGKLKNEPSRQFSEAHTPVCDFRQVEALKSNTGKKASTYVYSD